jgi:hypothetical protein
MEDIIEAGRQRDAEAKARAKAPDITNDQMDQAMFMIMMSQRMLQDMQNEDAEMSGFRNLFDPFSEGD